MALGLGTATTVSAEGRVGIEVGIELAAGAIDPALGDNLELTELTA